MEMAWDDDLATWAQQYAKKCKKDINGMAEHGDGQLPDGRVIGQNLAWGASTDLPKKMQGWVKEGRIYNVGTGRCNDPDWRACGHYSQMVWHSTNKIGCGVAQCPGLGNLLVCDYYPAGNILVKPGIFKPAASLGKPCSGCNLDPGTACDNGLCKSCNPSSRDRSCKKYDTAGCKDGTGRNINCSHMKTAGLCNDPMYNVKEYCAKSCGTCRS